jgi:putative membrane protein
MSKAFLRSTCLMLAGLVSVAAAQQGDNNSTPASGSMKASTLSASDQKFVKDAAEGGMAEVELGQLAMLKASSDDVKKFGQRMVDDHGKANAKLKDLASGKGITLPEAPNAKQEATKDRLAKLSGDQFDKAYMKDMLQDHKKDIAAFKAESNSGRDSDIKSFAAQTLPTLQDHLKNAQSISPKVMQARSDVAPPNASQR